MPSYFIPEGCQPLAPGRAAHPGLMDCPCITDPGGVVATQDTRVDQSVVTQRSLPNRATTPPGSRTYLGPFTPGTLRDPGLTACLQAV